MNSGGPIVSGTLPGFQGDFAALAGKMIPILNEDGLPLTNQVTTTDWPFAQHFSPNSCSIIGGVLDRSQRCRMSGLYFYADSLSYHGEKFGRIWSLKASGTNWEQHLLASPFFDTGIYLDPDWRPFRITAFSQDEWGRTYVANYGATVYYQVPPDFHAVSAIVGGGVYRIEDDLTQFSVHPTVRPGECVVFGWHSVRELAYQPQVSSNLTDWTAIGPTLPGTGALVSVTNDSAASPVHLFFRVLASPLNLP